MTTKATDKLPQIDWQIGDLAEHDPEERMKVYAATGTGADGNDYEGSAVFVCGEFEGIENIEQIIKESA